MSSCKYTLFQDRINKMAVGYVPSYINVHTGTLTVDTLTEAFDALMLIGNPDDYEYTDLLRPVGNGDVVEMLGKTFTVVNNEWTGLTYDMTVDIGLNGLRIIANRLRHEDLKSNIVEELRNEAHKWLHLMQWGTNAKSSTINLEKLILGAGWLQLIMED